MRLPISLNPNHPAFAGHFPGQPIVPGVVWLSLVLNEIQSALNLHAAPYQIQNVKFLSMVRQGDMLRGDSFMLEFEAAVPTSALSQNQAVTLTQSVRFTLVRETPKNQETDTLSGEKIATGSLIFSLDSTQS